jgi:DNA polymerase III alpha subunit (gram-positive type)
MLRNKNFISFDFETSSANAETCQILEIGSCAIDRNSLSIKDRFHSLVCPEVPSEVEEGALKVNGLKMEDLLKAPDIVTTFNLWAEWIKKYNINKNKNSFGAPVPIHFNGGNFDMPIFKRYCKRFNYWDKKWNSQTLLDPIHSIDISNHMWLWLRENPDLTNFKLTTILEYMGIDASEIKNSAHGAVWDSEKTAEIAIKLIKRIKALQVGKNPIVLKNCLRK